MWRSSPVFLDEAFMKSNPPDLGHRMDHHLPDAPANFFLDNHCELVYLYRDQ